MAILSNINGKFRVDSAGAVYFGTSAGTNGQILKSIGTGGSPTWVDASTVIGGPYLPLSGDTLTGATGTASGISFTVGGTLTVGGATTLNSTLSATSATFSSNVFSDSLYVNSTTAVAGTQVAIVQDGAQNLQRWGTANSGQASYRFRIDQDMKFIANSGSGDNLTISSDTGNIEGTTATFSGLVSGITPTANANFATKAYVDAHPSGTVTGSGTLNKVPRWTATGSNLGDGPITFATNDSTFAGTITSGTLSVGPSGTSRFTDTSAFPLQLNRGLAVDVVGAAGTIFGLGAYSTGTTYIDAVRIVGVLEANGTDGDMQLQVLDSGTHTTALTLNNDTNATFEGEVNANGNITTDGIFKVDTAPDGNILELDQGGRSMDLGVYFASNSTDSEWQFKTSTGNVNGATTNALVIKPLQATFAGTVTAAKIGIPSSNASYAFYNNSNSYFNGAVTVDSTFTQTGGAASSFSGAATFSGNVTCSRLLTGGGGNATDPMIRVSDDLNTGIFYPSADTFCITTGGEERARILSNGNFLIGTTGTTTTRLKVVQNATSEWACQITNIGTNAYGLAVDTTANTGIFSLAVYTNTGTGMFVRNEGKVGIGTVSPTSKLDISDPVDRVMNASGEGQFEITGNGYTFGIAMGDTTTALYHNSSLRSLTLGTDETPRLTILGGGNVGIGNTSPGTKLHVSSTGTSTRFESSGSYSDIQFVSTAGMNFVNFSSANQFLLYQGGGAGTNITTKIDTSGNATFKGDVIAYGSPSDIRLKENIKPIKSALDKVSKLNGVTFDWKEKTEHLDKEGNPIDLQQWKHDIGFIAQDVQKVVPELVRENDNGMLSMRHQGIAPILLEAIKELKAEIEELKNKPCNCK
jgi:hypothetical protein